MIFIDTTVWVAAIDRQDVLHNDGKGIVDAIANWKLPLAVITDYILDEVMTILKKRNIPPEIILKAVTAILESPRIKTIFVDDHLFMKGLTIFSKYNKLSFTDAITLAVMQKYKIKVIYSHDSDFDLSKITRYERIEK